MQKADFAKNPDWVDGAHYQIPDGHTIDLALVSANSGQSMLEWKATQGTTGIDSSFTYIRELAHQNFDMFMPYHWMSSTPDRSIPNAVAQGKHHLQVLGGPRDGETSSLDAEEIGITVDTCVATMETIENGVDGLQGIERPMEFYTGLYVSGGSIFMDPRMRQSQWGERACHIAAYVSIDNLWGRLVSLGRTDYAIAAWQWWSQYNMPGINTVNHCDINQGIDMAWYRASCLKGVNPAPVSNPFPRPTVQQEDIMYISNSEFRSTTSSDPGHAWFELMPGGLVRIVSDMSDVKAALGENPDPVTITSVQRSNAVLDTLLAKGPWAPPTTSNGLFPTHATGNITSIPGTIEMALHG